jgi:hypothetical protein
VTRIFVFGSNRQGIHGAGAALEARKRHGAQLGVGEGHTGHAYAAGVTRFLTYATAHPELRFTVTRIACGLAGHTDAEIAPMFAAAPANCDLPDGWRQ